MHDSITMDAGRRSRRFSIACEVQYRTLAGENRAERGTGRIIEISATDVLLTVDHALVPGQGIVLSINWPAPPYKGRSVTLHVTGTVSRVESGVAAVEIGNHEFRSVGSAQEAAPSLSGPQLVM